MSTSAILERMPYLEAVAPAFPCEVRLNDVPLYRFDGQNPYRVFVPAFAQLQRGQNLLELRFATAAPPGPETAPLTARLALFRDGEQAFVDGETLVALQLDGARLTVSGRLDSPVGVRELPWARLPIAGEAGAASLNPLLERLRQALNAADPEPILAAAEPRVRHMAEAFVRGPGEVRAGMAQAIAELSPVPTAAADQPPPPPARLLQVAYGRLVEPLGPDGQPWLRRPRADGTVFFYPVLMGQADGAWRIFL